MTPSIRVYATAEQAQAAVAELVQEGFSQDSIRVLQAMPGQESDLVEASVYQGFLDESQAKSWVKSLQDGQTIVSVKAPLYKGQLAEDVLDDHGPLTTGIPDAGRSGAAPMSDWLGMPAVINRPSKTRLIGSIHNQSFGFKLLSSNPAPLSSLFGMKLLSSSRSNTTLSRNPAPLSSKLGMPLLKS
ncbi:MAG: hypothetical protein V2J12_01420 [Gammaproteobacteria bacterium]|jgi:hypothetical protein|nr:hypothetical protein [Gammaproteobacteria bacterium]